MLNVQVHDSNVIKRLNKYGLFVRLSKWKPLSEKNMVAQFSFEKLHLHKRQASWTDDQRQGLAIMHSTAFDKKQTQDINTNTSYQLWSTLMETCWFGFGLRATEPGQYTLWADRELLSISKYSTVNCFHRFLFHEKLSTLHVSVIYKTKFTSDCFQSFRSLQRSFVPFLQFLQFIQQNLELSIFDWAEVPFCSMLFLLCFNIVLLSLISFLFHYIVCY